MDEFAEKARRREAESAHGIAPLALSPQQEEKKKAEEAERAAEIQRSVAGLGEPSKRS
jgi:hypothetical protein